MKGSPLNGSGNVIVDFGVTHAPCNKFLTVCCFVELKDHGSTEAKVDQLGAFDDSDRMLLAFPRIGSLQHFFIIVLFPCLVWFCVFGGFLLAFLLKTLSLSRFLACLFALWILAQACSSILSHQDRLIVNCDEENPS
jgi:hypothetical protein